jgi:serine/threonine protein kinase
MNYPLISEYIEAIKASEDNFATLSNLQPVLDNDGNPIMSSGNFAVVFKMKDEKTGKYFAIKCFIKEQEGREDNYALISDELRKTDSPYILSATYLKKELFVDTVQTDESEFPILIMDWVEGETLSSMLSSISNCISVNSYFWTQEEENKALFELRCLPSNFIRMASWLVKQPFAHGDIKPDNIIIKPDGTFVLVDYDGMFVPSMQGMNKMYTGTPNFRHPSRNYQTLNKEVDNYAISVIALSLCALSLKPELIEQNSDNCIISEEEVFKLHEHWMFGEKVLMSSSHFQELLSLYLHTISQNKLSIAFFDECVKDFLKPKEYDIFLTKASEEDLKLYWEDEFGVRYSLDGKKVLKASKKLENVDYTIREGVITICDEAFQARGLKRIKLPNSVIAIGDRAFANNGGMDYCNIPSSVQHIYENNPWGGCFNIKKMDCSSPYFQIKDGILYSSDFKVLYGMIYWITDILVDFRTKKICSNAFWSSWSTNHIKHITIFNVLYIGVAAFFNCRSTIFVIKKNINELSNSSFKGCESLVSIDLSEVKTIPEDAFCRCTNLKEIKFSPELSSVHAGSFKFCTSLTIIDIPKKLTFLSDKAFTGCSAIKSFNVDKENEYYCSIDGVLYNKSVTKLIKFPAGKRLNTFTIPDTVCEIGNEAFAECATLESITCGNKILKFGNNVFDDCKALNKCYIFLDERADAESAWNLGGFLFPLKNVSEDIKQNGFSLIKKAAEMNKADAQWYLARCYKYGWNGKKDKEQYTIWLKRSAENKDYEAMTELAREYILGEYISRDYKKAYELLNELENADADVWASFYCSGKYYTLLGYLYEHGLEVDKDSNKAIDYYKKGSDWDDCIAEYNLARCYEEGIGLERDLDKAKEYYSKAKEHNHSKAAEALQRIEEKNASDDLPF